MAASNNLIQVTTMLPKVMYSGQPADTSDHTLYTAPSPGSAVVKHGVITNVTGSSVTVTLAVVPAGGTVDGTHQVISSYPLAALDSLTLDGYLVGCCLGPGDSIHAQIGTAAAVDIVITGVENS